ncbi:MAG TPA: hypothetical protein VGE66_09105 [Chitinophagaceae bacterium]
MSQADYFKKAMGFIHEIGIQTEFKPIPADQCFLPGLFIEQGSIIIDQDRLQYPGDILHEAGHIAVVPAAERNALYGPHIQKRKDAPAEEMMVIAWSYAACIYLGLEPEFVFHKDGYHGGGLSIIDNFQAGRYIGVPVLQWLGMTTVLEGSAIVYPGMIKWMRD